MESVSKFVKCEITGVYEVIDTRFNCVVKTNIKSPRKAAAYVRYYNEEIEKAVQSWKDLEQSVKSC